MSKVKLVVAIFLAALTVTAVASASASAAQWYVNNAALANGAKEALNTTAVVDESAVLNAPKLSLKITCATLTGVKPEIIGKEKGAAEHLTFGTCSEIEPKTCKLEVPTVETVPITALVSAKTGTDDRVLFSPTSGKTFATLTFVGSCALAGEKGVNGLVNVDAPDGQTEQTTHLIDGLGSVENNSLEIGAQKAFIEKGKALLKLATGTNTWSFR
jgi:hypothetical protein